MNPPAMPQSGPAQSEGSGLAIASLILGILGIVLCLGPLTGIPAVICGHMAQARTRRSGGTSGGMVIAGLITGYISIAMIAVIGLLLAIAIPNFVKARQQALHQQCHANLRSIQSAKEAWALENRKTEDAIPTRADLLQKNLISDSIRCPANGRYEFNSIKETPACNVHGTIGEPQSVRWRNR